MFVIRCVVGNSMLPSFQSGVIVFGYRFKRPQLGDVVIAMQNGREVIKRIAGVKAKHYFLLGDNPLYSTDSRTHGWLDATAIKAVVVKRLER